MELWCALLFKECAGTAFLEMLCIRIVGARKHAAHPLKFPWEAISWKGRTVRVKRTRALESSNLTHPETRIDVIATDCKIF